MSHIEFGHSMVTFVEPHPADVAQYKRWYKDDPASAAVTAARGRFAYRGLVAARPLTSLRSPDPSAGPVPSRRADLPARVPLVTAAALPARPLPPLTRRRPRVKRLRGTSAPVQVNSHVGVRPVVQGRLSGRSSACLAHNSRARIGVTVRSICRA
jgi:hypothetical protein